MIKNRIKELEQKCLNLGFHVLILKDGEDKEVARKAYCDEHRLNIDYPLVIFDDARGL